jgi:hypothetical protein
VQLSVRNGRLAVEFYKAAFGTVEMFCLCGTATWTRSWRSSRPAAHCGRNATKVDNCLVPSAFAYHLIAPACGTINITDRAGRAASLLIVIQDGNVHGAK